MLLTLDRTVLEYFMTLYHSSHHCCTLYQALLSTPDEGYRFWAKSASEHPAQAPMSDIITSTLNCGMVYSLRMRCSFVVSRDSIPSLSTRAFSGEKNERGSGFKNSSLQPETSRMEKIRVRSADRLNILLFFIFLSFLEVIVTNQY